MAQADTLPCPDPASFVAEPLLVEELVITEPEHVARTVNVYAQVLVDHGMSETVRQYDERTP